MLLLSYRNEARKIPCEQQQKKIVVFVAAVFLIFRKRFYIFSDKILKLHSGFFFFSFHFMLGFSFQTDNTTSFACATTFALQNNVSSCL